MNEELSEAHAWHQALLESAGLSIIATDPTGVIKTFNRTAERMLGYQAGEVVGKTTPGIFHDPEEVRKRAAELSHELNEEIQPGFEVFVARARRGVTEEREWTYLRKDGSRFPVMLAVSAVRDAQGNLNGFLGIAADISERKRLEAQLQRFFSAGLDMFCIADFSGYFRRVNPAFAETLGWSEAELRERPFIEFIHPEDRTPTQTQFEKQLATGEPVIKFENRYQHKDGSWRWLSWKAVTFLEEQLVYATARDVTDQKNLHEELQRERLKLEEANQELESFSYSVSHDLRAPLRHVQGFAQLLAREEEGKLSPNACSRLKVIMDVSRDMGQLIDDLLAFSRMSRAHMSQTVVDLNILWQDTLRAIEPSAKDRNILWKQQPLPTVIGDRALLKQVLINLASNAVKYSRQRNPAEIEIGCAGEENGLCVLYVRDNGVGFNMKYVHKLFGVFQRLHRADEFEGTGIGLASVRRIINRHGGRVWAEAEPNRGATFYFTLPKQTRI